MEGGGKHLRTTTVCRATGWGGPPSSSRPFHKPVCAARREIEIHRPRRQGVSGNGGGLRDKKSTHDGTHVQAGHTHVAEWCEAVQLTHPWVVKVKENVGYT